MQQKRVNFRDTRTAHDRLEVIPKNTGIHSRTLIFVGQLQNLLWTLHTGNRKSTLRPH